MRSLAIWSASVGCASTIANYRGVAAGFLVTESDWPDGIAGVGAEQVSAFVLAEAARCSAGSLNNVTTGLRALLRWLHVAGYTPTSLTGAVPAAPGWRDSGLPRAVPPDQIGRLLASCDRRTNVGRRDRAILTVLARLARTTPLGTAPGRYHPPDTLLAFLEAL